MQDIYKGNTFSDGDRTRGWIIGNFIPDGLRHSEKVEIKWGVHKAGEERDDWVTDEQRTTVCILISGKFDLIFRDRIVTLESRGDYVMWGIGTDHKSKAQQDSIVLTVRWDVEK